jgi:Predicted AAA-ATPase/PD-(D/E)XK nuclease superfamily
MKLPIGYDNFGKIIENKLDFVDKSLFIQDILDDKATEVAVITRPRRFGKTFNLSMLHHFLAPNVQGKDTQGLFDQLKIAQAGEEYLAHQGKYPVISLTFKDLKHDGFQTAYDKLYEVIINLYDDYTELFDSHQLTTNQKKFCEIILNRKASQAQLEISLQVLTECLFKHCGQKPYLLIDEYDTPLQAGYINNYYDKMVSLVRNLLSAALKSNPFLQKAVITGILRVAKESLFSGLNNLKVYSVLNSQYSEYFGFTKDEVDSLLRRAKLEHKKEEIQNWYNGYQVGNTVIYNPWSIVNCIQEGGELEPYWVNTSDNKLVRDLLIKSSEPFKDQFELLMRGEPIERIIDEHMVFGDLKVAESGIWNLLLMSGYLKPVSYVKTDQGKFYQLAIPNREVRNLYRQIIELWLSNGYGIEWYNEFLRTLLVGDINNFKEHLNRILLHTASSHDIAKEPEAFYHGLMLGLTASLYNNYETKSNKESGFGRYDFLILPKDINKLGIILEFKSINHSSQKKDFEKTLAGSLDVAAAEALHQIDRLHYIAELEQRGVKNILKIGIAYCGKRFSLAHAKVTT